MTLDGARLYLGGHHRVSAVVTQKEAERRLETYDLWSATYHSIAVPETAEAMRLVDITASAPDLRFLGKVDRLPRAFSALHLQSARLLTPASADIIRKQWHEDDAPHLFFQGDIEQARLQVEFDPQSIQDARERVIREIVTRQGQYTFRESLLKAYENRCAISECNFPYALEAAHIYPYRGTLTNAPANGILLRSDLHTLFDLGLIGVDPVTLRVLLSPALQNSTYARFSGRTIRLPSSPDLRPSKEALDWHSRAFRLR